MKPKAIPREAWRYARQLQASDPQRVIRALQALQSEAHSLRDTRIYEYLVPLFEEGEPTVRQAAVNLAGAIGDKTGQSWVWFFYETELTTREIAARHLVRFLIETPDPTRIQILCDWFYRDPALAERTMRLLTEVITRCALPVELVMRIWNEAETVSLVGTPLHPEVQTALCDLQTALVHDLEARLQALYEETQSDNYEEVAEALTRAGRFSAYLASSSWTKLFLPFTEHDDPRVWNAAIQLMGKIADTTALQGLIERLAHPEMARQFRAWGALLTALENHPNERVLKTIINGLESSDPTYRDHCIALIAHLAVRIVFPAPLRDRALAKLGALLPASDRDTERIVLLATRRLANQARGRLREDGLF